MTDLFKEILPSITVNKNRVESLEGYTSFVVNKALSAYQDCIFLVNMVNLFPDLPAEAHYDFLLNTVRAWKRPYIPWLKKSEKDENLDVVMAYYGVSERKGKEYLALLSKEQISQLIERMNKGGVTRNVNKKR